MGQTMRPISKVELKLEKHISKLKGQLAAAQYALDLLKTENPEVFVRHTRQTMELNEETPYQEREIPLFS